MSADITPSGMPSATDSVIAARVEFQGGRQALRQVLRDRALAVDADAEIARQDVAEVKRTSWIQSGWS